MIIIQYCKLQFYSTVLLRMCCTTVLFRLANQYDDVHSIPLAIANRCDTGLKNNNKQCLL